MTVEKRMSPFTALFLGVFGMGAVSVAAASAIVLYGMRIVDQRACGIINFAGHTIDALPELIDSLPPTIRDALHDRRAPEYAANLDVSVKLLEDERSGALRPAVTVTNNGDEVVSLLAVRVAALTNENLPVREWTQVVATPVAIEGEWRGPIMPHAVRHVVLSRGCFGSAWDRVDAGVRAVAEISELRVWERVVSAPIAAASAGN